jgi:hypothetical protein
LTRTVNFSLSPLRFWAFAIGLILLGSNSGFSQTFSFYLIGDAGEHRHPGPALQLLEQQLQNEDERSAVIFLGDNVYPKGVFKDGSRQRDSSVAKLFSQLDRLKNYPGQAYVIPGNHDWRKSKWGGLKQVQEQEKLVNAYLRSSAFRLENTSAFFLPRGGFPGPASVMADSALKIRLIVYDAQWWLQRQWFHRAGKEEGQSYREMSGEFFEELRRLVNQSHQSNEHLILASHHPLLTGGHHGVRKNAAYILATFTPLIIFRPMGLNRLFRQDITSNAYQRIADSVLNILALHPSAYMVAGHDHNLQVFNYRSGNTLIVSGAGSKTSSFAKNPSAHPGWMSDDATGFFKLTFAKDRSAVLRVFTPDSPSGIDISPVLRN